MNVFSWFLGLLGKVFRIAQANGLTDALIKQALALAKEAANKFATNEEKREWVVKALLARRIPESLARFALEAAIQLLKAADQ